MRFVPYLIRTALAGEPILCSSGTQIRDFLDTAVCGRALAQLLASSVEGVVNIGAGETPPLSLAEIVEHICAVCNCPHAPQFGALPMKKDEPHFMVPDISRLRNEVKFTERQDTRHALSMLVSANQSAQMV